jgi:hypothetical protein
VVVGAAVVVGEVTVVVGVGAVVVVDGWDVVDGAARWCFLPDGSRTASRTPARRSTPRTLSARNPSAARSPRDRVTFP